MLPIVLGLTAAPHAVSSLQAQERQDLDLASRTFVAMPLVNTNPAMKTSFGGIGMVLFRHRARRRMFATNEEWS